MATHDYVIANGTGSAVRSDLNNALAAIVSNNSSSSEPATKYAYQWWADTTTGQLKLRNSANNGWVTIFELDGTMLMEDGTVSAPGLAFASDLNTGFFRSAADKINFATGGVERLEIGSSEVVFNDGSNDVDFRVESNGNTHMLFVDGGNDRVGMGTTSPQGNLSFGASVSTINTDTSDGSDNKRLALNGGGGGINSGRGGYIVLSGNEATNPGNVQLSMGNASGTSIVFNKGDGSEVGRWDSSGRLLVGVSSSRSVGFAHRVQIEGTDAGSSTQSFIRNSNDTSGPQIDFAKSRGTSTGSNTVVQDGDVLGEIKFRGADGTDAATEGARITASIDGTPGSNDMPGKLTFSTTADSASSPSERLRIDSSGHLNLVSSSSTLTNLNFTENALNTFARIEGGKSGSGVGDLRFHTYSGGLSEAARFDSSGRLLIGTTTTSVHGDRLLEIGNTSRSSTYATITTSTSGTGGLLFADSTTNDTGGYRGIIDYAHSLDAMRFYTASSERMRITSGGDIFVAVTNGTKTNEGFRIENGGQPNITRGTDGTFISFYHTSGSVIGSIQNNGGTGTLFNTSSDYRLKENVVNIADGVDRVKQLSPKRFNFIADNTKTVDGFLAHEVQTIVPESISGEKDAVDENGDPVYQGIDQSKLVPLLTAALQEAIAKIETLETKVAALEAG